VKKTVKRYLLSPVVDVVRISSSSSNESVTWPKDLAQRPTYIHFRPFPFSLGATLTQWCVLPIWGIGDVRGCEYGRIWRLQKLNLQGRLCRSQIRSGKCHWPWGDFGLKRIGVDLPR